MRSGNRILLLFFYLCFASVSSAQKSPASESDLKKQASKLFEKQNYKDASPMYSQLLSLYSREAIYNYRYGICLLLSGTDKTGAATYLEAASKVKETDPDVYFYLGRSYMFMDHYNEAIAAFTTFKENAPLSKQNTLHPDIYIKNCENADQLRRDRKNIAVLNKRKVNRSAFFAPYDFTEAAGKLLTTPDRFLSPMDKEKISNPVMFMTKDGETIYYASYGKKGDHGKDIYRIIKLPDGTWSIPENLSNEINTDADEDYPYLDKDGRTLYFSSNGSSSMGGYDVFKSQYNFNTGRWSSPVNFGVPVNTVDDDIFFMPSVNGLTAVYSTAIDCETGKIEVRNIKLGDAVSNVAVISGKYFSQDQITRRDARVSVVRTKDNGVVTSVKTDRTGEYELVVPAGEEYMLIVEGGSYLPHAELFSVPRGTSLSGLKQRVTMNKSGDKEEMTMSNFFSPADIDSSLASIEKPTQVVRSEFDLKDTATGKMQTITFEGRTLFVAPPQLKNAGLAANEDPYIAKEQNAAVIPDVKQSQITSKNNPEVITDETEAESVENTPEKSADTKESTAVISDKTSNSDLVKMAFEDALAVKEEVLSLREDAEEKRAESRTLDSLSKVLVKEANELLSSGEKEKSQEVFRQSQEDAQESQQKIREAQALEADAREKDAEATSAYADAAMLMKEFNVDTSVVAYKSNSNKEKSNQTGAKKSAGKPDKTIEENSVMDSDQTATTEISHGEKAKQLQRESDELLTAYSEMTQKAETTKDKTRKEYYQKKAADLQKQGNEKKVEADKEVVLSIQSGENPIAIVSGDKESSNHKSGQRNNSNNTGTAKVAAKENSEGNVNSQNDIVLNENPEINAEQQNKSKNSAETKVPSAENSNGEENFPNDVAINENRNESGKKSKKNNSAVGNDSNEKSTVNESNAKEATQTSTPEYSEIADKLEKVVGTLDNDVPVLSENKSSSNDNGSSGKSGAKTNKNKNENKTKSADKNNELIVENKNVDVVTSPSPEKLIEKNISTSENKNNKPVNADPVAINHFQNYLQSLDESKKTETLSKQTETKLFEPNSKSKRDSLENKTAELNRLSISQWQEAQKELLSAKQIDPEIEEKMVNVQPAEINSGKTNQSLAENNNSKSFERKADVNSSRSSIDKSSDNKTEDIHTGAEETVAVLDTTKPEYAKYVETQKQIIDKQTETVNIFVEGMKLNKQAIAIKTEEMKLRDQAEMSTTKKEKKKLTETADSLAMEADIITGHSKEMLSAAQKNTGKVKELVVKSNQLKETLIVHDLQPLEATGTRSNSNSRTEKGEHASSVVNEKEAGQVSKNESSSTTGQSTSSFDKGLKGSSDNRNPEPGINVVNRGIKSNSSGEGNSGAELPEINYNENKNTSGTKASEEKESVQNISPVKSKSEIPIYPSSPDVKSRAVNNTDEKANDNTNDQEKASTGKTDLVINNELQISDGSTFSLSKGDAYSAFNPIPIDPELPQGLVFKVQIGAFRKPLPDNTFKNLQPLSGETSRPGWIRYCLGLFRTFEPANLLKKVVRGMGYPDAFVVAYYNGKRIPLYDAYAMISKTNAETKQKYSSVSKEEFSHLAKFEIRQSNHDTKPDNDTKAFYGTNEIIAADVIEYAVQVGVYKSSRIPSALNSLVPLNTEEMNSGLFRFTTGRYQNRASADSMKRVAVSSGVKDAFVVIYKGGKKATASQVQRIQADNQNARKDIATANNSTSSTTNNSSQASGSGNTSNAEGIIFKVQIGAFKENVPLSTVNSFLLIADKGIAQETDDRGLHIFYAGSFSDYNKAVSARDEIVDKGIKDAFIVGFSNGKRISATEALKRLNGN